MLRQPSRGVKHPQDFHAVAAHPVGDDVPRLRHDQLPCTGYAPGATCVAGPASTSRCSTPAVDQTTAADTMISWPVL